jgi:hypothetical protein
VEAHSRYLVTRSRFAQVLTAALVIGLLASSAYAIGASQSTRVLACAKKHGGALRLAKHCRHTSGLDFTVLIP